jgi:hypothetical protein
MDDKRITPAEVEAILQADVKALAARMAKAINDATAGRIIDESEEPVRDAHAEFRQQAFQKALDLLQNKALQGDFSPSQDPTEPDVGE